MAVKVQSTSTAKVMGAHTGQAKSLPSDGRENYSGLANINTVSASAAGMIEGKGIQTSEGSARNCADQPSVLQGKRAALVDMTRRRLRTKAGTQTFLS